MINPRMKVFLLLVARYLSIIGLLSLVINLVGTFVMDEFGNWLSTKIQNASLNVNNANQT